MCAYIYIYIHIYIYIYMYRRVPVDDGLVDVGGDSDLGEKADVAMNYIHMYYY